MYHDFNPRARVGRDRISFIKAGTNAISIHAPAWGATGYNPVNRDYSAISIHAPAWGATSRKCACSRGSVISIHAPAWGATPLP